MGPVPRLHGWNTHPQGDRTLSTEIDWRHELDGSFGPGHDLPPDSYVVAGRRAVRRRRTAAVAVAATVAICGGAVWAATPGSAPRSDDPVATHGPRPTAATESPDDKQDRDRRRDVTSSMSIEEEFLGNPAVLDGGKLKLSPLAGEVLQRVPNPMGYTPDQGRSTAIRVIYQGREQYSLIASFGPGDWSINTNDATGDFAGWVDANVQSQRALDAMNGVVGSAGTDGGADPATWLELGPDGAAPVPTRPGVVPVEFRADVDLGVGFAPTGATTGVVRLMVDGESRMAAYRVIDGQLDVISGPGRFDSLAAFITWARGQYESGEGMR